jgi:hypothetical protein
VSIRRKLLALIAVESFYRLFLRERIRDFIIYGHIA